MCGKQANPAQPLTTNAGTGEELDHDLSDLSDLFAIDLSAEDLFEVGEGWGSKVASPHAGVVPLCCGCVAEACVFCAVCFAAVGGG